MGVLDPAGARRAPGRGLPARGAAGGEDALDGQRAPPIRRRQGAAAPARAGRSRTCQRRGRRLARQPPHRSAERPLERGAVGEVAMHGQPRPGRPALFAVPEPSPATPAPVVSFCTHCGTRPEPTDACGPSDRVCGRCQLGLLLETRADCAPRPGDAFLVVDGSLSVCAVSAAAEELLAPRETDAVNRHITELLVPADAETREGSLAVAITWAARGDGGTRRVVARPANTFGVRL